jgi:predicted Fe-Mo cluster-binding NifX family protein
MNLDSLYYYESGFDTSRVVDSIGPEKKLNGDMDVAKIAVSSIGDRLESVIDPRFGRCNYFVIVDTETMEFKAVPNPAVDVAGGAGIQAAQAVTAEGVSTVVTGAVGPHAMTALNAAGKEILSGTPGTVRQNIDAFTRGDLKPITDVGRAYGVRPLGFGMGRGGRGGRGRGHGRGGSSP